MASKRALCGVGLVLALVAFGVTGCANVYDAPLRPASGFIYTSYTLPLDLACASHNFAEMEKVSSENFYIFWPYPMLDAAWGDNAALGQLARAQRFGPMHYAEVEITTVLGLFGHYTVNVYASPTP